MTDQIDVDNFLAHYGVPGMKWGKRNAESKDRHRREQRDGVKYQKSTYNATKNDANGPIKKHYTTAEIKAARKRQAERMDSINAIVKSRGGKKVTRREGATDKELDLANQYMGRDSVIAKRKTKGEKVAIAVGAGAVIAVGAAITMKTLSKNGTLPMSNIMDRPAVKRGQQNSNSNSKPAPQQSKPSVNNASAPRAPKPPSPYPMTPIIATPILDEIMRKYNL